MKAANRVVANTAILYGRMLLTMGISLYSTRLVLNALGSTDYGIYNLVAGIIVMLSFLNSAMATSSQRYLSYHQGKKDIQKQKEVFTNSFFLHIIIGFILVLSLEIAGLFLFDGFLNIPADRIVSARIIYHYMAVTVFFTVITVPFNALLIAHENMLWVAFVNIIETLLKLGIALLLYVVSSDKLVVYGMLTASIVIFSFVLYASFCLKKYPECTFKGVMKPEKSFIKDLTSFAGWNLFGALCGMGRNQGIAVILNLFLGAAVNAAYGIANQVSGQMIFLSATLLRALNPQIMKSEGANDRVRMLRLANMASKFSFYLIAFIAIPSIFEMKSILGLWLVNVPPLTVIFCNLILIGILTNQLTIGLQSAFQAIGDIKFYQIIVGSLLLLNLPVSYILLYNGYPAYSVLISYIITEFIACVMRVYLFKRKANFSITNYLKNVTLKEIYPVLGSCLICFLCVQNLEFKWRLIVTYGTSILLFITLAYFFGLESDEKRFIKQTRSNLILKFKKS
ncbi:MATE family efflux transporter [Leeuwenhoekiella sp. A2]|uniref:MATE family efflux transporter n=1 Tax=Leeuwenhoekiella sp. A2 TaxID=3141460 RepID=UPI003A7FC68F